MPTYRTANNTFAIQQIGFGSTGTALNTANLVDGTFFGYLAIPVKPITIAQSIQGAQAEDTSSVTIAPTAAISAATTTNPTAILGSLSFSPMARNVTTTRSSPTVVLSSILISPAVAVAKASRINPAYLRSGPLTQLQPSLSSGQRYGVDFEKGPSIELSPSVTGRSSVAGPTVILGSVAISSVARSAKTFAGGIGSYGVGGYGDQPYGTELQVILGSTSLSPVVRSAVASKVNPTVVLDLSLRLTPTPAAMVARVASPTLNFSGGPRDVPVLMQLQTEYLSGQRYKNLDHSLGHDIGTLTQLQASFLPGQRYGNFSRAITMQTRRSYCWSSSWTIDEAA